MSLWSHYFVIPLYFCLSIIFPPSLIHRHAPCWHDLPCNMHKPSWSLAPDAHLYYTLYHLCYQTGFAYQMDRWPMDCTVKFLFLGTSCVVSFIFESFSTLSLLYCTTQQFFSVTQCALSWANQSQAIALHGQGICCYFAADEPCAWFLIITYI